MGTVTLTQFIQPNGRQEKTTVDLPDEICKLAEQQVLSCEMSPNDYSKVIFYSYPKGCNPEETEDLMFADNGPGENSPANILTKLIKKIPAQNAADAT